MATTKTLTVKTTHNMMKAKQRNDFMEAGGYDGRFRSKTVPSAKSYKRTQKHKGRGWE